MKKQLPWNLIILFTALWIGLSVFWVLFAQGEKNRAQEGFRYDAERLADQVLRSEREGTLRGMDNLPEEILGFALYTPLGYPTVLLGDVPSVFIPPREYQGGSYLQPQNNGEYTIIKDLAMPRFRLGEMMHQHNEMPPPQQRPPSGYLFLKFKQNTSVLHWGFWDTLSLAIPTLLGATLAFITSLLIKNARFQEEIRRSQELVKFSDAARTLSHELKNPVAAILLQTNLLKRTHPDNHEVAVIEEEALRISHLAEKVRDFLKDPVGLPEKIDLSAFIKDLLVRFPDGLQLTTQGDGPWNTSFDTARLRSVLENLIQNALESGDDPQVHINLHRQKTRQGPRLIVQVLDRGQGLRDQNADKAFEPFYTTKERGSGIGLPIARIFTQARGGRITLASRDGGGCVATLILQEVS